MFKFVCIKTIEVEKKIVRKQMLLLVYFWPK